MLEIEWDDSNLSHIARHGVTRAEFEEVLFGYPYDLGSREEGDEVRFSYIGETARGRILLVVITERGERLRPVTAFEPSKFLRKLYLESKKT